MSETMQRTCMPIEPCDVDGVYAAPAAARDPDVEPRLIDNRPVQAMAPHPDDPDRVIITAEHPDTLDYLPDPYIEL